MTWLGVCSTIFCYQHSLPSIVKGFFFNNFLESYPVDSSLYSQSDAKLRSPPLKKKVKEAREQFCLDVPSPPFHLG